MKNADKWMQVPIRAILGFGFMAHGVAKLGRAAGFAALLQQIGIPQPHLAAWAGIVVEIIGGAAIFVGAFVPLVSVPLIAMMLVAMVTVHARYGFSAIKTIGLTPAGPQFGPPGYEVNLLYIAGLVALIIGGAGAMSVDQWRRRHRPGASGSAPGTSRGREV